LGGDDFLLNTGVIARLAAFAGHDGGISSEHSTHRYSRNADPLHLYRFVIDTRREHAEVVAVTAAIGDNS